MINIACLHKDQVASTEEIKSEFDIWQNKWSKISREKRPKTAVDTLAACNVKFFPNIHYLLKVTISLSAHSWKVSDCFTSFQVFCTLPVTSATAECSFLTMRRLKTYLRNTKSVSRHSTYSNPSRDAY